MQLDRFDSYRYVPEMNEPFEITVTEHRALLEGETLVLDSEEITIDDGPFVIVPDPDYEPLTSNGVFGIDLFKAIERHGKHEGQEGVEGQQGGSAPGYSHKGGAAKGQKRKGGRPKGASTGISADRPRQEETQTLAQTQAYFDKIGTIDGVSVSHTEAGEGGWMEGDAKAMREIATVADVTFESDAALEEFKEVTASYLRDGDQDFGFVYGNNIDGRDTVATIWTFDTLIDESNREAAVQELVSAEAGGWQWRKVGGSNALVIVDIAGNEDVHRTLADNLTSRFSGIGLKGTPDTFPTKVITADREGKYEWQK